MGKLAWDRLRTFAWNTPFDSGEESSAVLKQMELFLAFGITQGIGIYNLEPLTRVCIDPLCTKELTSNMHILCDRELGDPQTYPITVFTKELGALPGFSTSRYCNSMFVT